MVRAIPLVLLWLFIPLLTWSQIRVLTWDGGHKGRDSSFIRFVSSVVPDSLKSKLQIRSVGAVKMKNEAIELLNRRTREKTNTQIVRYSTTDVIQMFGGPVILSEFKFKDAHSAQKVFNSLEKNEFHIWGSDFVYNVAVERACLLVVLTPMSIAHITTSCCGETTTEELTSKEEHEARGVFIDNAIKRYAAVAGR